MDIFTQVFPVTFLGVAKVFLIIFAAGILVRLRIVAHEHIKSLSIVTVNILLPCLVFSSITRSFDPKSLSIWWILPLAGILIIGCGIFLGSIFFFKELPGKKNMLALSAIPNAVYLSLPLGQALFPDQFDQFATYTFLYFLGVNPLLWSIGKYLATSGKEEKLHFNSLITPPFISNILAVTLVFTGVHRHIPEFFIQPIEMLGQAAVPLANFILGAVLGGIALSWKPYWKDILRAVGVKLIGVPLIVVCTLQQLNLSFSYPLLAVFLVIQGATAPATNLILLVRKYGGDEKKISSVMLAAYIICILTLPLWISLWRSLRP